MNFETFMSLRFGEEYHSAEPKQVKKLKTQSVQELMQLFSLRQPSVWAWTKTGIPADRAIEIVKHYKFAPEVLLIR